MDTNIRILQHQTEKDNSDLTLNFCLDVLEAEWKGEVGQQLLEKNV